MFIELLRNLRKEAKGSKLFRFLLLGLLSLLIFFLTVFLFGDTFAGHLVLLVRLLFTGRFRAAISPQLTLASVDAPALAIGTLDLKIAHIYSQLASTSAVVQSFVARGTLGFGLVFGTLLGQSHYGCALTFFGLPEA